MGNHFHLLVKMLPDRQFTDSDIKSRLETFCGEETDFADEQTPYRRNKLSNLSEFMREIKVGFSRYYNRRHNRRGYFWGERFKSGCAIGAQSAPYGCKAIDAPIQTSPEFSFSASGKRCSNGMTVIFSSSG